MAFGEYGGDGSVRVKMGVRNRREPGKPRNAGVDSDDFVDYTADGGTFDITIKLPDGGAALTTIQQQLRDAANAAGGSRFALTLPIEANNDTTNWPQIRIEWPDTPKQGVRGSGPVRT